MTKLTDLKAIAEKAQEHEDEDKHITDVRFEFNVTMYPSRLLAMIELLEEAKNLMELVTSEHFGCDDSCTQKDNAEAKWLSKFEKEFGG